MRGLLKLSIFVTLFFLTTLLISGGLGIDACAQQTKTEVVIQSIQPFGDDEIVTIINNGDEDVDLTGWCLQSSNSQGREVKQTFWFPRGCVLPAGGTVRVHSGPYARGWGDKSCGHRTIDLPWYTTHVWSDKGDVAWLRNNEGELVDRFSSPVQLEKSAKYEARPSHAISEEHGFRYGECCCYERTALCEPCIAKGCLVEVVLTSVELVYNNCVGDNWKLSVSVNEVDPPISLGDLPTEVFKTVFKDSEIYLEITATATEEDNYPDVGSASRTVTIRCPPTCKAQQSIPLDVRVVENECRYTGNDALWRFNFQITATRETEEPTPLVAPSRKPTADFEVIPSGDHFVGDKVTLDASRSFDPGGGELQYNWDLDYDGTTDATGVRLTYELRSPGGNPVRLTVVNAADLSDSITKGIRVQYAGPTPAPMEGKSYISLLFWAGVLALVAGYILLASG